MGAKLLQDVRQDLADVVQVCEGRKKQTNYLRTLINELVKGVWPCARWPCAPGAQHRARPHVSAVHASFCLRAAWCPCLGGRLRKTQEPIFSYMPVCVIVTFLGGLKSQGAGSPQGPRIAVGAAPYAGLWSWGGVWEQAPGGETAAGWRRRRGPGPSARDCRRRHWSVVSRLQGSCLGAGHTTQYPQA